MRDELRLDVIPQLADPTGVLVLDETGLLNKGEHSAGVARQVLTRAFTAGVPAPWVIGDRVYGNDRRLRRGLEDRPQPYVLAVSGQA